MKLVKATQVTPRQLYTLLLKAIPAKENVLITGPPGVGKTDITGQAIADCGAQMILSHPAVEDPTKSEGLPWMGEDGNAVHKAFGQLRQAIEATSLTAWVLDDLGNATPAVQAGYMQLLLAHAVNEHVLSEHVTFVAATNRREDRTGVSGILEAVKSRFTTIVELVPDLNDWCLWYLADPARPPIVAAFLRFQPDLLCQFTPSADLVNCPLPRTWAAVGRILNMELPDDVETAAIAGCVGEGAAATFKGFLRMYRELPNIDLILTDPDAAQIPESQSALWAIATALAARTTEVNFGRVVRYAQRLADAQHGEIASLCIRDATRREPKVQTTPDFVRMQAGPVGELLTGNVA